MNYLNFLKRNNLKEDAANLIKKLLEENLNDEKYSMIIIKEAIELLEVRFLGNFREMNF